MWSPWELCKLSHELISLMHSRWVLFNRNQWSGPAFGCAADLSCCWHQHLQLRHQHSGLLVMQLRHLSSHAYLMDSSGGLAHAASAYDACRETLSDAS